MAESVVIDANLTLALAIATPYSEQAAALMTTWKRTGIPLYAPLLWEYECVTALRKATALGLLEPADALAALDLLWALGIERVPPDPALHRQALHWATQLQHTGAYDGQYLAVAEHRDALFYTADLRLARQAASLGATWVRPVKAAD